MTRMWEAEAYEILVLQLLSHCLDQLRAFSQIDHVLADHFSSSAVSTDGKRIAELTWTANEYVIDLSLLSYVLHSWWISHHVLLYDHNRTNKVFRTYQAKHFVTRRNKTTTTRCCSLISDYYIIELSMRCVDIKREEEVDGR